MERRQVRVQFPYKRFLAPARNTFTLFKLSLMLEDKSI